METRTRVTAGPPVEPGWTSAAANPEKASADVAAILQEANDSVAEVPSITFPADDIVTLPGGLVKNGTVIKTVQVKELNGSDEESIARTTQALNPFLLMDRLLKCGVVKIGDFPEAETEKLLGEILVGDREQLMLGIRNATYGDKLNIDPWRCPSCGVEASLSMQLEDIPVTKMSDPLNEVHFEVPLKRDKIARCHLASGADQVAVFEKEDLTPAERESILLTRCIDTIVESTGLERSIQGFATSFVLGMNVVDRHAVLNELNTRQPGPKYNQVKHKCDTCGKDVTVTVTLGNLFLDFGWL